MKNALSWKAGRVGVNVTARLQAVANLKAEIE